MIFQLLLHLFTVRLRFIRCLALQSGKLSRTSQCHLLRPSTAATICNFSTPSQFSFIRIIAGVTEWDASFGIFISDSVSQSETLHLSFLRVMTNEHTKSHEETGVSTKYCTNRVFVANRVIVCSGSLYQLRPFIISLHFPIHIIVSCSFSFPAPRLLLRHFMGY